MVDSAQRPPRYIVYILKCSDGSVYVGCTSNLRQRLGQHVKGMVPATESRRPVVLMSYTVFTDRTAAFRFEKYLKSGSGRVFITRHLLGERPPGRAVICTLPRHCSPPG